MILALVNIAILRADNSSQYLLNSIIRVTYALQLMKIQLFWMAQKNLSQVNVRVNNKNNTYLLDIIKDKHVNYYVA